MVASDLGAEPAGKVYLRRHQVTIRWSEAYHSHGHTAWRPHGPRILLLLPEALATERFSLQHVMSPC